MGGLSNIIDGIYNDDSDKEERVSADSDSDVTNSDVANSDVTPAVESVGPAPSLQQLADQMSEDEVAETEMPNEARFVTQDDVFETPAYENDEELPPAPIPPEAVSSTMIERLKFVAPEVDHEPSSTSEFTIAPPPEGITSEGFEDEYDGESARSLKATLGGIASESSDDEAAVDQAGDEDLLDDTRSHSGGSFIWTRDADDILPGRRGRR